MVGEDDAGTYLHYILPAHPDHNCEKDALVRRQRGPEGSYPSLSGRWGDQVDWTQILLADYFTKFPPYWANRAVHLCSFTVSALCLERHHCSASSGSQNKMECECVSYLLARLTFNHASLVSWNFVKCAWNAKMQVMWEICFPTKRKVQGSS